MSFLPLRVGVAIGLEESVMDKMHVPQAEIPRGLQGRTSTGRTHLSPWITIAAVVALVGGCRDDLDLDLDFLSAPVGATRAVPSSAVGTLDLAFDMDGVATTHIGAASASATGIAIQPDGKIVAVGYCYNDLQRGSDCAFTVVRYNVDGSLDSSFDTDGIVTTRIGPRGDFAFDVAVQPDGKIVAAGTSLIPYAGGNFALARYNADGSLDTSFGGGGIVTTDFAGMDDRVRSVRIQPDGRIVAAGHAVINSMHEILAVVRYNADGSLDTAFGTQGKLTTDIGPGSEDAYGVALQPDGRIVAAGWTMGWTGGTAHYDFAVVRYGADGSLDTTFDGDGKVTTVTFGLAVGVAVQADGKIVAVGSANGKVLLVRYGTDGSLDASFGIEGMAASESGSATRIAIQADGRILVSGSSAAGLAVRRYNADGSPDASFGTDGAVTTMPFGSASGVAIQSDGRIVAVGSADGTRFVVVRYR